MVGWTVVGKDSISIRHFLTTYGIDEGMSMGIYPFLSHNSKQHCL